MTNTERIICFLGWFSIYVGCSLALVHFIKILFVKKPKETETYTPPTIQDIGADVAAQLLMEDNPILTNTKKIPPRLWRGGKLT